MGLLGKTFDFNEDSMLTFENGVMEFTILTHPKYDEEQQRTLLREAGLDPEELRAMDKAQRRQVLEDAKLNPSDFTMLEGAE